MMNIYEKLDALYDMAVTEQVNGTAKLKEGGTEYDDGTIQGVMEHIPFGQSHKQGDFTFTEQCVFQFPEEVIITSNVKSITAQNTTVYYHPEIKRIIFEEPAQITNFPTNVFRYNSALEYIKLPSSLTSLPQYAFYGLSKLTDVEVPEGMALTSLQAGSFSGTGISQESFEAIMGGLSNEAVIFDNCFQNCPNIKSAVIPSNVSHYGASISIFYGCSSLEYIEFQGDFMIMLNLNAALKKVVWKVPTTPPTTYTVNFVNSPNVEEIILPEGWCASLLISNGAAVYPNGLTSECLNDMAEKVADLTGQTKQTLTLGKTNKDRLTSASLELFTAKNWNIT